jgi:REP element-mobilizing transposase RayT
LYNWFYHLKSKGHFTNGYVIMPNHLHALIAFRNTGQSINTIVGNGKRFIAYEIIKRLGQQKETELLQRLNLSVEAKDRKRNKNMKYGKILLTIKNAVPISICNKN